MRELLVLSEAVANRLEGGGSVGSANAPIRSANAPIRSAGAPIRSAGAPIRSAPMLAEPELVVLHVE